MRNQTCSLTLHPSLADVGRIDLLAQRGVARTAHAVAVRALTLGLQQLESAHALQQQEQRQAHPRGCDE